MLDFLLEALVDGLVEVIGELVIAVAAAIAVEFMAYFFERKDSANPVLASFGLLILAATSGLATSVALPQRVFPKVLPLPGISLILAPLCTGLLLYFFGEWRRGTGHEPSRLATWWGGGLFAFSMAVVRWLMVGRG
jgi:hypothetical protein